MDKVERKSKVLVRVEFLDSPYYQKVLGEYLKKSGEAKALVMSAVSSLFLALAVSDRGDAARDELERIARKCRREMLNHISNLDDFFMLKYKINLKSDRPQNDHPNPSIKTENTLPFKHEEDEDDLSDLSKEEYLERMKSRIDNPQVKD